jgi:hypothetical protein
VLNPQLQDIILKATGAVRFVNVDVLQNLWDGYGEILRIVLDGSSCPSVVVKHVQWPNPNQKKLGKVRPDHSHQRKVRSYQVEMHWYDKWSSICTQNSRVPHCLARETVNGEVVLVLEDLDSVGFPVRKTGASIGDAKICLKWLAYFHAQFMGKRPDGLWKVGTYWHLATRPDELKKLTDLPLRNAAAIIDRKLQSTPYQTIVHGDAKLENFCFSRDSKQVAAVDFQYVGGGCGMKDVAYLISSCFTDIEAGRLERELLDYYFVCLRKALSENYYSGNVFDLEKDWRSLYHVAWTDFYRFLKGWTLGNWSKNSYSERVSTQVIAQLTSHV